MENNDLFFEKMKQFVAEHSVQTTHATKFKNEKSEQVDPAIKADNAKIEIYNRTTRDEGDVRLRFRLTDGRAVQLFHKSHIRISIEDLAEFDKNGKYTGRKLYKYQAIQDDITKEIGYMRDAYRIMLNGKLTIDSTTFEKTIDAIIVPDVPTIVAQKLQEKEQQPTITTFIGALGAYIKDIGNSVCKARINHYKVVEGMMKAFLKNSTKYSIDIALKDVTPDLLQDFWNNLLNDGTTARTSSTATSKMKMLKAFFNAMEKSNKVDISPFRKIYATINQSMFPTNKDVENIYYLYQSELEHIINTSVPENLQETKDAFLLQCAFGCRVGDFASLTMDNISVNEDGIPFVHYVAHKTLRTNKSETETPVMYYAIDIIKRYRFKFRILNYVYGEDGYNRKIKALLKYCKIDRKCSVYDDIKKQTEYKPLHELASSKLGRKTHIDIMNKVQIYKNIAHLHKDNSNAIDHYTHLSPTDRFVLMCSAFHQPQYKVDDDLNILSVEPVDSSDSKI